MATAIETSGLVKRYGDVTALGGLDLTVDEGEIFGFLGPNGAGKSTTIDILLDYVHPTAGTARVLGLDAQESSLAVRRRVGVLPDTYRTYDRLTGRQHLVFVAESKDVDPDLDALLDRLGIREIADRRAGGYSRGQTQRLVLAMSLVGDPDLLILDEPTAGLDPAGVRMVRDIVREERARGATVFLSSHQLPVVEAVADRVAILRRGTLVAVDTVAGLRRAVGGDAVLEVTVDAVGDGAVEAVEAVAGVSQVAVMGTSFTIACAPDAKLRVLEALEGAGASVRDFATRGATLEELFLAYADGEVEP